MKPEQLNRLIRAKGQVQPWFLRNTTELYECAIRSYYERSSAAIPYSAHNRNAHQRLENAGPVRKLKRAHPEPTAADNYPHNHRLQTDLATSANSNKLLNTVIQATRRRSLSFSVGGSRPGAGVSGAAAAAQPYSVYGQSVLSGSSSSCSTATSSSGTSHDGFPGHFGRRTFLKTTSKKRPKSKKQPASEKPQGLFSAGRSFSLPPRPSFPGMDSSVARPLPPNTKHHLESMLKNSQVNFASLPRSEGDNLMVVDAALKRRISVVPYDEEAPQPRGRFNRLPSDGGNTLNMARRHGGSGNGNESGNRDGSEVVSQSSEVRYRFQTLADRIKQFEYIQFADGPVTSFAFDRRQKTAATKKAKKAATASTMAGKPPSGPDTETEVSNATSSSSVAPMRRKQMAEQPRELGYNNVLHSNHRQRSRSLEMEPPLMESIGLLKSLEKSSNPTTASPRGSSVDSPPRSFFRPAITSTWAAAYAARNAENGGASADSDVNPETAVRTPPSINAKPHKKKIISRKSLGVSRAGSSGKIRPQTPTYTAPPPVTTTRHASPPGSVSALESEASTSEINWRRKPKTSGAKAKNNNWTIGYNANYGSKAAAGPQTTWAGITRNVNLSPGFRAEEYASGTISRPSENTLKKSYRASIAGPASASRAETIRAPKRPATAPATTRGKPSASASVKPPAQPQSFDLNTTNLSPVRRFQMQQQGLEEATKDTETPLLSSIIGKAKPMRPATKSAGQSMEQQVASMVRANVYSRTSHRAHAQLPQDTPNSTARISIKPPGQTSQVVRKRRDEKDITADRKAEQRDQEAQLQKEVREESEVASTPSHVTGTPLGKQPVYPKGANQLLVASATQVSAYKRAFRSQQQMLKADMLNQQAKLLQQEENPQANFPPSTSNPKAMPMPMPSPVVAGKFRSGEAAIGGLPLTAPPLQSHRAPPLPTGRAGVRPIARRNGAGESSRGLAIRHSRRDMGGAATTYLRARDSGSTGLRIKADGRTAGPITAPAQAIRPPPPTFRSLPDSTTTTTGRTAVPQLKITTMTKTRGSKQSINAAKEREHQQRERTKEQNNRNRDRNREGARARMAGGVGNTGAVYMASAAATTHSTRPRRTSPSLTAQQQQHSRHGNGTSSALLGFRRETPSRAATRLLQRREDSGLQSRSQSQSQSPSHLQQQSQRRQFHYTVNPPWRPVY